MKAGRRPGEIRESPTAIDKAFGKSERPVYDDADLIQRVIEFANGETDRRPAADSYRFALAMDLDLFPDVEDGRIINEAKYNALVAKLVPEEEVNSLLARDKLNAVRVLRAAATDHKQLIEWINSWRARYGDSIGMGRRPKIGATARSSLQITWPLELDSSAPGGDVPNALAYVAALMLSDLNNCRTNLGYCRLPECGRFFVVERGKPGKPRRDYCSTAHMKAAHERNSARRHQVSRERKKAEAAKGGRRRSK